MRLLTLLVLLLALSPQAFACEATARCAQPGQSISAPPASIELVVRDQQGRHLATAVLTASDNQDPSLVIDGNEGMPDARLTFSTLKDPTTGTLGQLGYDLSAHTLNEATARTRDGREFRGLTTSHGYLAARRGARDIGIVSVEITPRDVRPDEPAAAITACLADQISPQDKNTRYPSRCHVEF